MFLFCSDHQQCSQDVEVALQLPGWALVALFVLCTASNPCLVRFADLRGLVPSNNSAEYETI